ncbi:protein kinase [Microbulbifer sp. MLAF003]|uniref:serine/threonine-protein kinase n=1 Tax=unclassified Microbulbifer TaxID=2619833 RepID=UPI0024AE26CD|nr:serine/threonine-protein kinase [Microbulbifer sp. MLAF003]WHI51879.1 protein kinase [Microbulbifer sp. MLAF003]
MDVVALEKTNEYQGRYRVERTLGAGGMGVVYLAEDIKLGRKVAIKQLRSDMTGNSAEARFRSEAQLLAKLNHPNIVRLYDVIEEEHKIALVMELVEGVTLKEWMREHTPTLAEKLELLMQVSLGLDRAHSLGIIHRDLKPENILVTIDGVAKITDFGIAKTLDCDQQLTREDHIAGSVQAMSPEQLQGIPLDARSDLFSLGSIAYELLCGCKPFERGSMSALAFAQQITTKPHIPPQQAWPGIPKTLGALLDRLLGKRPDLRPDSAQQVYEALEIICKYGIDANTKQYSETVTQLLIKPRKKHGRIIAALMGLGLLTMSSLWGWYYYSQLPPQYIAVLPVNLNGDIHGKKDSDMLLKAMVRQALMSSATQLKSSAIVSFTPEENTNQEQQLEDLHNRGVTTALAAQLNCLQLRCNIEIQRISTADAEIQKQISFVFLSDKHQEAQYTIGNSTLELFPASYRKNLNREVKMESDDYKHYLSILSKDTSNIAITKLDLEIVENLIGKYPQNTNLYALYARLASRMHSINNDSKFLTTALGIIASAEGSGAEETALLEAKLLIKASGTDKKGFEATLKKLQAKGHPSAHLLVQFARFQYTQGNYDQGLIYAKEAAAMSPSARNLYFVAINQLAIGDYESTRKTTVKLIENYPGYWPAYAILGVIELETGNLTLAEKAITSIPEDMRSWRTQSNLGIIFFLQKKYSEALKVYLRILEISPNNIQMHGQVAETYLMLNDRKNAENNFDQVLQLTLNSTELRARRWRAEALANLGKTSDAIALIKELLRESPDDTYVKYSAAQVYALAGEWQSAGYHLNELLALGMSKEWFSLHAFKELCSQSQEFKDSICLYH